MKYLGLSFSARTQGNCFYCLAYCAERLKSAGHETRVWNLGDFTISCCQRCGYECFQTPRSCPLPDDLRAVYEKLTLADGLLCAVPTYGGHANGLYRAFMERMQMMAPGFQTEHFFQKVKGLIVIGNRSAGGHRALQETLSDFETQNPRPEILLLSAAACGRRALAGDLIDSSEIRTRLDSLLNKIGGPDILFPTV